VPDLRIQPARADIGAVSGVRGDIRDQTGACDSNQAPQAPPFFDNIDDLSRVPLGQFQIHAPALRQVRQAVQPPAKDIRR
jgi:hypothetical protein